MAGNANSGRRHLSVADKRKIGERILANVAAGSPVETAITAAGGISTREAREWLRRGRELIGSGEKPADEHRGYELWFAQQIDIHRATFEAECVRKIHEHGFKDWKALAWILATTQPKKWGTKINVTVKEELDAFLDRLERKLPEEVYEAVLRAASEDELEGETQPTSDEEAV